MKGLHCIQLIYFEPESNHFTRFKLIFITFPCHNLYESVLIFYKLYLMTFDLVLSKPEVKQICTAIEVDRHGPLISAVEYFIKIQSTLGKNSDFQFTTCLLHKDIHSFQDLEHKNNNNINNYNNNNKMITECIAHGLPKLMGNHLFHY